MTILFRFVSVLLVLGIACTANAEVDPLNLFVRTTYPPDATYVGEAVDYLLEDTGYKVVLTDPAPRDAYELVGKTIDPLARLPRTMTLTDALLVLIGPENYLVVDREHKLISFTRSPE